MIKNLLIGALFVWALFFAWGWHKSEQRGSALAWIFHDYQLQMQPAIEAWQREQHAYPSPPTFWRPLFPNHEPADSAEQRTFYLIQDAGDSNAVRVGGWRSGLVSTAP